MVEADFDARAAGLISPQQHNKLMKEYEKRGGIGLSAAKAGVDRKTESKYIGGAPGPLEPRSQRGWRTHEDESVKRSGWVPATYDTV
jgi:hypothetical protein